MAKHKKKNYYAVLHGHISPAICTDWSVAHGLVDGYKNNEYKGFDKLEEAISFVQKNGYYSHYFLGTSGHGERAPREGGPVFYAVANGRHVGVYEGYKGGAEEEVKGFSHACHKSFATREEAEKFIEAYQIIKSLVNRERKGRDLENGMDDLVAPLSRL